MQKSALQIFFIILFLNFFHTKVCAEGSTIVIDCLGDQYKQQIHELLPYQFFLHSVLYEVDFLYEEQELSYLTSLRDQTMITKEGLLKACFYLREIDRFKIIHLIIDKDDKGYKLLFHLSGKIVFSRLIVSGSVRDKEFYKNMYLLDIGEFFDEQKHKHSLEQIRQHFYDRGYCNARIFDSVKQDDKRKQITVSIVLDKGSKFLIDDISFKVESIGDMSSADVLRMKRKIEEICCKKLHAKTYNVDLIKKMRKRIHALLERYGFMNFEITLEKTIDSKKHKINLNYSITLEQKKEFVFFGNNYFKKQDILDHLLMYGKSSWHFPSSIIIDELVQLYKNKGFWNVSVSIREEKRRVFCLINEGKRVAISGIKFKDNDHISSYLLERLYKPFLQARYFEKDLLKKSSDQLIRFYKQQGFWDVQIFKEEFEEQKNKSYMLVITIDEGKQRKIGSYKIPQYPELEKQGPFLKIKKEKGLGLDQMILLEQKQWLLRYFRNLGYTKVTIAYELEDQEKAFNVVWNIILHEQAIKFGKVLVTGASVVPPSLIMREVTFSHADAWDKSKLEETLKRLRDLDLFESVQIYPSRDLDDSLQKPVFLKVIDAPVCELRTRLGMQQIGKDFRLRRGFTYKMGGTLLIRNPLTIGDRLLLEADVTRYYRNFAIAYNFPWILKKSINCQYKLFDTLYNQPIYIGSKNSLYQAGQRGFLFSMIKSFSQMTMSGTVGVNFMGIKEADQPQLNTIIEYDQELLAKRLAYIFMEPTIMWQRVDNLLNPHTGHLSFISCKAMFDVDNKTTFLKLLLEHSFYIPFKDSVVMAIRIRAGHVFNRLYNQLIPIERFYLGGANTLRGYDRDYCPPLGTLTNPVEDVHAGLPAEACNLWKYAPQGARTMFNFNAECRFSIYKSLSGVLFNDVGALYKDSVYDVIKDGTDNFFVGIGFGIRYDTPIGPLRFDIGFKLKRTIEDFESRWAWYLTLGHAF